VAGLAAAACFAVIMTLRELPFPGKPLPAAAGQLAKKTDAARESIDGSTGGQRQASNHVEIRFPTTEGGASAAADGETDQWGVVLPNASKSEAEAAADIRESGDSARQPPTAAASAIALRAEAQRTQRAISDTDGAVRDHPFVPSAQAPNSRFPIAVDPAGYANVRRMVLDGRRPPRALVRLEELVNFFSYDYAAPRPEDRDPLAAALEVAAAPWNPLHRLVRVALKARGQTGDGGGAIVARDVAVQVEFNPARVQSYRLIGYENPASVREGRAGETGAGADLESGREITAFYEVIPISGDRKAEAGDGRGGRTDLPAPSLRPPAAEPLLTFKVRYRTVEGDESRWLEFPLVDPGAAFADASSDFRFAAAVAGFGLVLRDSPYKSGATLADVLRWAEQSAGSDLASVRGEFISLVKRAQALPPSQG